MFLFGESLGDQPLPLCLGLPQCWRLPSSIPGKHSNPGKPGQSVTLAELLRFQEMALPMTSPSLLCTGRRS